MQSDVCFCFELPPSHAPAFVSDGIMAQNMPCKDNSDRNDGTENNLEGVVTVVVRHP